MILTKRKHRNCSGPFHWKSCDGNDKCSQGLTAAPCKIQTHWYSNDHLSNPIKTFQKQLNIWRKMCLVKWEEKIENSKDCPSSPRYPNASRWTKWENETRISYVSGLSCVITWKVAQFIFGLRCDATKNSFHAAGKQNEIFKALPW